MTQPVKATLSFSDGRPSVEMPLLNGQIGPDVMDIRPVAGAGIFTYDPGFLATASTKSAITFIDGDKGVLLLPRLPDRAAGREVQLPRDLLPAAGTANCRPRSSSRPTRRASASTPCCTSQMSRFYQRLPSRRAPDGGDVRHGRCAVGLLPRLTRRQPAARTASCRCSA
jgi:hypothetical protein